MASPKPATMVDDSELLAHVWDSSSDEDHKSVDDFSATQEALHEIEGRRHIQSLRPRGETPGAAKSQRPNTRDGETSRHDVIAQREYRTPQSRPLINLPPVLPPAPSPSFPPTPPSGPSRLKISVNLPPRMTMAEKLAWLDLVPFNGIEDILVPRNWEVKVAIPGEQDKDLATMPEALQKGLLADLQAILKVDKKLLNLCKQLRNEEGLAANACVHFWCVSKGKTSTWSMETRDHSCDQCVKARSPCLWVQPATLGRSRQFLFLSAPVSKRRSEDPDEVDFWIPKP